MSLDDQVGEDQETGKKFLYYSTAGLKLCMQWKDGFTSLSDLLDIKEPFLVQAAEYTFSKR